MAGEAVDPVADALRGVSPGAVAAAGDQAAVTGGSGPGAGPAGAAEEHADSGQRDVLQSTFGSEFFAENGIFGKSPPNCRFDVVWQAGPFPVAHPILVLLIGIGLPPPVQSVKNVRIDCSELSVQDKPLRMLRYRPNILHAYGWIPAFPHGRNLRGTVLRDPYVWLQARPWLAAAYSCPAICIFPRSAAARTPHAQIIASWSWMLAIINTGLGTQLKDQKVC